MLTLLREGLEDEAFPPLEQALAEPNGLLAVGGDLSPRRLYRAYRAGIFPWYEAGQPILWWSPDPRLVIRPGEMRVSRSLAKLLRRGTFQLTVDRAFAAVIDACAAPRRGAPGTWITPEMREAYLALHRRGLAHSAEAWLDDRLVGGLYGVALGRIFFGESMFHRVDNASKAAFVFLMDCLERWGYVLADCQVHTLHLVSLGAFEIPRREFARWLAAYVDVAPEPGAWQALSTHAYPPAARP